MYDIEGCSFLSSYVCNLHLILMIKFNLFLANLL